MDKSSDLGSFDDYKGPTKLTAEIANDINKPFVCVNLSKEKYDDQEKPVLKMILENGEDEYFLSLNKTNLVIVEEKGFNSPNDLIGKKFYFGKRKVTNPTSGKLMDSLYIEKIE